LGYHLWRTGVRGVGMECEDARELFQQPASELEEDQLGELAEHLEGCRRCKFTLRKEPTARSYAEALGLDLGLKEPVQIKKVLIIAAPAVMVVLLLTMVLYYFATKPPEPKQVVPGPLQHALEECKTLEGVRDWAVLAELEVGPRASVKRIPTSAVLVREIAIRLARRCETPPEAERLRRLLFKALGRSVPESEVEPSMLGSPAWAVPKSERAAAGPTREDWKLTEALELESCFLFEKAAEGLDALAAGATDPTVKRRAQLHGLYCRMHFAQLDEVAEGLEKLAADQAATDQGRIAKRLAELARAAASRRPGIAGRKKAIKRVPDMDFGREAVASLDWEKALHAFGGEDQSGPATFARAHATRMLGCLPEALDEFVAGRNVSRDSNLASLSAVEAGRHEMLFGNYDQGLSWITFARNRSKKLSLSDAISLLEGFIYLQDYDSPTVASGCFTQITTGKQQSPVGLFSLEVMMPEMERNSRVRTGERGIIIDERIFTADFEKSGAVEGLSRIGSGVKLTRSAEAAFESRAGVAVSGGAKAGGIIVSKSFTSEETVIAAHIRLESEVEKLTFTVQTEDKAVYRTSIYGIPSGKWCTIVFPMAAMKLKSGTGRITGKVVTKTVIAIAPAPGKYLKFSIDDVIVHNGSGFPPEPDPDA